MRFWHFVIFGLSLGKKRRSRHSREYQLREDRPQISVDPRTFGDPRTRLDTYPIHLETRRKKKHNDLDDKLLDPETVEVLSRIEVLTEIGNNFFSHFWEFEPEGDLVRVISQTIRCVKGKVGKRNPQKLEVYIDVFESLSHGQKLNLLQAKQFVGYNHMSFEDDVAIPTSHGKQAMLAFESLVYTCVDQELLASETHGFRRDFDMMKEYFDQRLRDTE